jgi:hypothetical protein
MRDKRTITYNQETKQWTCIDLDGTEANFLSLTDLRDWLDYQEQVLKVVRKEKNVR